MFLCGIRWLSAFARITHSLVILPEEGEIVALGAECEQINNDPITIYGDGSQTRSFCYIDDLITGVVNLMNIDYIGPVNLGNPDTINILELAKIILKLTNSNSEIIFKKLPQDDPKKRRPDITLAKELLNWSPKINLEEGLNKTIEYFNVSENLY